ncbi:MAG: hypothetical protein QOF62_2864 [Pyrinomonadaceae bacterium]|nr:hypothetical protein [Pyrinomonadaceae bacterium]
MKPAKLNRTRTFLAGSRGLNHGSRFAQHESPRNWGFVLAGLLVALLVCGSLWTPKTGASVTTVFTDNFNRATLSPGGTPSMTYSSTLTSNITSGTVSSSYLSIGSGATAPANGVSYTTGTTSTFSSPYNTTLSSNPGLVTWTFNFRWNRASSNNPAQPASGAYGTAIVLAGSNSNISTLGSGYAIIYGSSGTPDPIRLVAYANGVTGTLTNICSSAASDLAATNNYASVRVTYDPATNNWSLFVRDDGASAWADPSSGVTTQKGVTTVNSTSTGISLATFGFLWSYATGTNLSSDFDNFSATVAQPSISVTGGPLNFPNTAVGSNSAEQTYTVSGSNLTANLVVTAPSTDFQVSTTSGSGFGSSVSLTPSSGTVANTTIYVRFTPQSTGLKNGNVTNASTGATTQNVAVSGTGIVAATPTINVSTNTLSSFGNVVAGGISSEQTYTVSGSNLTADISITAPADFQISTTSGSGFGSSITLTQSGGTVGVTTIYARFAPATTGAKAGNISHTSTGATTQNVAVSGNAISAEPNTQASGVNFTSVTQNSMTVNWTNGTGSARIVVGFDAPLVGADPVDGTSYSAGGNLGNGRVLYVGSGNSVNTATAGFNLEGNTTFYFAVYEFNGSGGTENYLLGPATGTQATPIATYTWNGSASTDYQTGANWTPTRAVGTADVLQFNNGATVTVTNVGPETIGQLSVTANTNVTLQTVGTNTLTISGGSGTDLSVAAASQLNAAASTATDALTIALATGATGSISGSMSFSGVAPPSGTPHRLTAVDANGITFQSGSVFTVNSGVSGPAFGSTNLNSIVFASGSTYVGTGGSSPFAATQPASVVIFQTGSLFKHQSTGTPSFSGRTYANFEMNIATTLTTTGGAAVSIDNLTVTQGTLNFNMTGTPGHAIKGNISVASGATLNFSPATAATVDLKGNVDVASTGTLSFNPTLTGNFFNLSGSATQTISGAGTLTLNSANQTVVVNNANGVSLSRNVFFSAGTLTLTTGNITTGANTLQVNATLTRTNGYVIGNLQKNYAAAGSKTFEVGTANGYSPVDINVTTAAPAGAPITVSAFQVAHPSIPIPAKALSRYWKILGATLTGDITLHYLDPTDIPGTATEGNFVIQKFGAGFTQPGGSVNTAANTATVTGQATDAADWTLAEPAAFVRYQSKTSGNWNDFNTWQVDSGSGFVDAVAGQTPTSAIGAVTIRSGHVVTITSNVTIDETTVNSGGTLASNVNTTLNDGSGTDLTIDGTMNVVGAAVLNGAGSFALNSGGTLGIGGASGITSGIAASGSVQNTGGRTFDTAANYTYNGSSAQVTGSGLPATVNNLKINNNAGVTLSAVATISGSLTIGDLVSNSFFNDGGFQITSTGTLNLSNASTFKLGSVGTGTSFPAFATRNVSVITTVEYASNQPQTIAAVNYSNLTSSGSGARTLASIGTIGIGEAFTPGTNSYTITGSTIDFFKATSQTIPAFNYNNLSNSGNGQRTYVGTVGIAGTFDYGGGGPHTVTGSTIEFNGTSAQTMASQGFTFNNLTINNAAGVTAGTTGSPVNVNGTLSLKNGMLTNGVGNNLTMANGATIDRSGGRIAATPLVVGTDQYNVTYSGSATLIAEPEIPSSSSVLGNLTLSQTAGDIDATAFGSNITVNGTLTMNQSTDLALGSNVLVMAAGSAPATGGTGQGDINGKVRRTNFLSGTSYNFGSPFVRFGSFTFVGAPSQVDVTMIPQRPETFSQAVKRTFQIDVSGGTALITTLRLHYRDDVDTLNGNSEGSLDLWKGPSWTDLPTLTRNAPDNWVETDNVATFSPWTFANTSPPGPGPTAVKLSKFNAASFVDGVQLTWESGFEVNNLGYRLYREQNGKRTRVTPSIVAGSTLLVGQGNRLTAGYSYSWFDPQGTADTAYYLEAIDLDSSRQTHGPIYPFGGSRNSVSPKRQRALLLNELGKSLATNSGGADASGWPASMPAAARSETLKLKPQSLAAQQAIAGGKAVKLQVRRTGWYRATQPELVAAGFDPSSDARLLQLYVDGEEVPVRLSAEGARLNANDTLEFYGVALDTQTTDTRTYWLVNGTTAGKRISAKRNKIKADDQNWTESPGLRSFAFTAERREKLIYSPRLLNGDGENIFGALIFTDPTEQTLAVKNFDREAATPVQLEVALQGLTAQAHEVRLMLNGADLGSMTFAASAHSTATFTVNRALLHEGDNTVSLASSNGDADISFVDYVRLTYAHQYTADNNALRFSVPGGGVVRVDGFSTANIRVVDITDPNSPLELATSGSPSGAGYSVKVQALGNETRTLMAFADDMTAHPASITANQPSKWNASTNGADLVIITHKDFRQAVEPLAALRRNQGLSVAVVDAEDVYDEFSYGAHTPSAIKAFLMNAAGTWARKPGYLLLVGDSSWDPRNFMDQGANDFVPTKLIDTNYMETASDDWLVDFTGQGRAEMALGRLPGRTAAEVSLMVSKIMAYEQERELNAPLRGAVMVADNGFESQSAQTSALLPAGVAKQSLNRAAIGNDDLMRGQLLDALNQGPMIVNFYGHGSVGVWTGAGVLDSDLADTLTNTNRSSIYLMMTCLNGYAHDAYVDSLSESVLKAPNGGAVAVWASSGFTPTEPQFAMDSQFYRLLFGGQPLRLGEAARQAKLATTDLDVRRTWILLGDPTMRVR